MKALVFDIRLSSLYSIRIPFTWQSALTYPLLPPSSVIGMLANAMQRLKNDKHPLEYLDMMEDEILWAGSKLLTCCIIKSYTTSAIVKWEDVQPWKFTNALGRQYAFSKEIQTIAIFKNDSLLDEIRDAVKRTPLTCGDSESSISVNNDPQIFDVETRQMKEGEELETQFPFPFDTGFYDIAKGSGKIFLVHERCKKSGRNFPLEMYMFPLRETEGVLSGEKILLKLKKQIPVYFTPHNEEKDVFIPQKYLLKNA